LLFPCDGGFSSRRGMMLILEIASSYVKYQRRNERSANVMEKEED